MVAATAEPDLAPAAARPAHWFRGDVDGLRAVAILLVVAYHAGLPFVGGGFIGVDVFFVISGFLISRNLLAEAEGQGRVALIEFWARRIRRLVPALALVVGVTLIASYFVLPLYSLDEVSEQGAAAALYVSNIYFANQTADYFATEITTSPFLHTWSLGVEEQFYLVWPVVFAAVCLLRRRGSSRRVAESRRRALIAAFSVALVASLALSLRLTDQGSSWAFFGLPSRAWEFAAAGLLAAVPVPGALRNTAVRTASAVGGLALIGLAALVLDDATPYPGLWALLPVVGTVLVIVAGETFGGTAAVTPVSRALSTGPMQWLGRVSYSWYLWHWPAIVLLVVAVDNERVAVRTPAAVLSLPVAFLAYRYFETPVRFSPVLAGSRIRTFGIGLATTVLVVAMALILAPEKAALVPTDTVSLDELQAPPGSSLEERVAFAVNLYEQRSETSCPGTGAVETEDGDKYCVDGDPAGATTLLLMGDSHAGQWRRALSAIAASNDIRLLIRQHNGCSPYQVPVAKGTGERDVTAICAEQQEGNLRVLERLDPDAVILATWSGDRADLRDEDGNEMTTEEQAAAWERGVDTLFGIIDSKGIPVGLIQDAPTLPFNVSDCLTAKSVEECAVPRDEAFATSGPLLDAEDRVLEGLPEVPVFDTSELMCDESTCHMERDDMLVFVDAHHLTDVFATAQLPQLEEMVAELTG